MSNIILIESTYAGPIPYFQLLIGAEKTIIEQNENFVKATYRNRCKIASPDGILNLSVPIRHGRGTRRRMKEIEIFNDIDWQKQHWQTLCSAYRRSPYFEYYEDELEVFYQDKYDLLLDFNQSLFTWICEKLDFQPNLELSQSYVKEVDESITDIRPMLYPNPQKNKKPEQIKSPIYHQVFEDRIGFMPDLSILDLLFAEGPNAMTVLGS